MWDWENWYGPAELVVPPAILAVGFAIIGGYKSRKDMASLRYAADHVMACIAGFIIAAVFVYIVTSYSSPLNPSRGIFLIAAAGFCVLTLGHRRLLWFSLRRVRAQRSFLVVASPERAARFLQAFQFNGQQQQLEFVALDPELVGMEIAEPGSPKFESSISDLPQRLHSHPERVHEGIIVALEGNQVPESVLHFLATVHFQDMPVYSVQAFYEAYWEKMPVHLLTPTWPLQAGFHLVKHSAFAAAKRGGDALAASVLLVLLSPVLALVALAVRMDSCGPVIFRQTRVGQHRRPFTLYKFRTMHTGSEEKGMYTEKKDPRVTRVGKFLRVSRLDELPQLVNVLRGDMSLIGPRAEWIKCVEEYEDVIPHYHFRHLVRPGITGWAQVNYPYGAGVADAVEKLMYDLYYIRNFSLGLDMAVVLKTVHVMLFGRGR